jgi:hypothetical protein
MHVNEAGRNDKSTYVDFVNSRPPDISTHRHDAPSRYCDIRSVPWRSGTIHYAPIAEDQVVQMISPLE